MPKKIKNVFFKSLTFQKFLEAHNRAKKNKMYKNEVLKFDLNLESNIISIINGIKNNTFKVGDYYLPYRDRVVHQWYVEEFVKPYIMPKFIGTSFACLPDRGTHKAVSAIQKMMQKYSKKYPDYYILKCDIRKYFNSIDTNVLFEIMKKYIDDKALLNFTHQLIFEKRPFNTPAGIPIRKLY